MKELIIKLEHGKWFVNGKPLIELTPNEKQSLDHFFSDLKNSLEKANKRIKRNYLKKHNYQFK